MLSLITGTVWWPMIAIMKVKCPIISKKLMLSPIIGTVRWPMIVVIFFSKKVKCPIISRREKWYSWGEANIIKQKRSNETLNFSVRQGRTDGKHYQIL